MISPRSYPQVLVEEKLRQLRSAIVSARPPEHPRATQLDGSLGGEVCNTRSGPCYVVERRFALGHRHGRIPLAACQGLSPQTLALLARAPDPPGVWSERVAFLDTETTGLSGGTGTYVFLVGLGFFQHDSFVLRQYLMRDYAEEAGLLEAVAAALAPFALVVTFNGKAFDQPLLETRYLLARRPSPLAGLAHVDLLYPARRLWRHRLEGCRLSQLESLFGHERVGDVPSWMVPSLYFAFLRRGEAGLLQQVLEHNCQDVLSLAALVAHLGDLLEHPHGQQWSAEEVYGSGRLYEAQRQYAQAGTAYARASELAARAPVGQAAAARLAALHKRSGRWDLAVPLWRQLAATASRLGLESCVELAKHSEHRARDYAAALGHTYQALELLEVLELRVAQDRGGFLSRQRLEQERRALGRRLARLLRLGRHRPRS